MTDVQILTLAIAVVVPLALLMLSNNRLTDLRTSLHASVTESKETLRAEAKANHVETIAQLKSLDAFLHDAVMSKLDDMDRRLTALEASKR